MKTVCKKLFSLMLVAILLVSALPFAASAAGAEAIAYNYKIVIDGYTMDATDGNGIVTAAELYDFLEMSQGEDAALDAWIASVAGTDVKSGNVVLTFTASSGEGEGSDEGEGTGEGEGSGEGNQSSAVSMTLTVYDKNDERVESKTAEVPAADVLAWQNDFNGNLAAILAKFGSAYTAADVKSGYANASQVVIMLNTSSNGGTVGGGNVVAGVTLKTDYCGNIPASVGDKYLDVLPTPAKPGQEFSHWFSENLNRIVKADDIIEASDNLTAYWKAPTKYSITFIDERGDEPAVVKAKQVAYGSEIGEMPVPAERDGYVFMYWKVNGKKVDEETVYEWQGDVTAYAHWKLESDVEDVPMGGNTATADGEVYLEIYVNGDTAAVAKSVKITDLAKDNKITQAEVESVVKKYITAKKGYTLKYEGLFDEETWWWYTRDPETNGAKSIVVNRDGDDYVYVMVKNVKTVESDPTNPKTGDGIFAVMSVMMGSGAALVSLNELRKRKMF